MEAKLIKFFIFIEKYFPNNVTFMTYCEYLNTITGDTLSLHKEYHDNHYEFPIENDDELFERLMFEINHLAFIVMNVLYMSALNK